MEKAAHVLVGSLFAGDGAHKLAGALGDGPSGVAAVILGMAGLLELAGGLLVAARARKMAASSMSIPRPLVRRPNEGF